MYGLSQLITKISKELEGENSLFKEIDENFVMEMERISLKT